MEGEHPLDAARREFQEETGFAAQGDFLELGAATQPGGKVVTAWAFEGDCDPNNLIVSNFCQLEWPPYSSNTDIVFCARSGNMRLYSLCNSSLIHWARLRISAWVSTEGL